MMDISRMGGVSDKQLEEVRRAVVAMGNSLTPSILEQTTALYAGLHDGQPPDDVAVTHDLAYGTDARQRIDIFKAVAGAQCDTALLFVHGGGFVAGDKRKAGSPFYENIGIWAARNGFVGATMTYRLAPASPWPTGAEDVAAAAAWLTDQAALGVKKVILFGQSAGAAHVATAIALEGERLAACGVAGSILLSGVYDLTIANPNAVSKVYYGEDASLYASRSSQGALAASKMPMLVGLAEYDPVHFQRQTMGLIQAIAGARKVLPPLVQLLGHNHLSGVLHLGLPNDQLGLAIKLFAAGLKDG